jgi:hypothetical protein
LFDYLRQKHYEERKMFEGDAKDVSLDLDQVVEDEEDQDEANKEAGGEAEEPNVEECEDDEDERVN